MLPINVSLSGRYITYKSKFLLSAAGYNVHFNVLHADQGGNTVTKDDPHKQS